MHIPLFSSGVLHVRAWFVASVFVTLRDIGNNFLMSLLLLSVSPNNILARSQNLWASTFSKQNNIEFGTNATA